MKTRRFLAVSVGAMVLSVGLFAGSRDGIAPAAPPPANPAQPFDQMLTMLTQLQTQVNGLPTSVDLRGVTQNWDRTLPANDPGGACPNNSSRFTCVMGGAAVRDNETGLVWEKSPATDTPTWYIARGTCAFKNVGGRKGWRLPSFSELASLVDTSVASGPILPTGHPFINVQPAYYWSATTGAEFPVGAWAVTFDVAGTVQPNSKTTFSLVWCVRGGMNADQY